METVKVYDQYRRILRKRLSRKEIDAMRMNVRKLADLLLQALQLNKYYEDKG